jgi:hypothetical protein
MTCVKIAGVENRWLELIEPSDFSLEGYEYHAPMAV